MKTGAKSALLIFICFFALARTAFCDENAPLTPRAITSAPTTLGTNVFHQDFDFGQLPDHPYISINTNESPAADPKLKIWIAEADRSIQLNPTFEAYFVRGMAYSHLRDMEKAFADYNACVRVAPTNYLGWSGKGVEELRRREWDLAIVDLSEALRLHPDDPYLAEKRAEAYLGKKNYLAAVSDDDNAAQWKSPPSSKDIEFDNKIFPLVVSDPDYVAIFFDRALARISLHDIRSAIGDFNKVLALAPDYALAYNDRGLCERDMGQLDKALSDYNLAIAKDSKLVIAYLNRAPLLQQKGDLKGAIGDYTKILSVETNNFDALFNRAPLRQAIGDVNGAMADFTAAIQVRSYHTEAYAARGFLYYNRLAFTNAAADFQRAVELGTSNLRVAFRLCLIRSRLGDADLGKRELSAFMDKHKPSDTNAWGARINLFLSGQWTETEFFNATSNTNKTAEADLQCEAYFYAGTKRLIAGDKTNAIACFEKVVATDRRAFVDYQSAAAELAALKATP